MYSCTLGSIAWRDVCKGDLLPCTLPLFSYNFCALSTNQCMQGIERRGAIVRYSEVAGGAFNNFLEAPLCHSSRF